MMRKFALKWVVCSILLGLVQHSHAATWSQHYSLPIGLEYDSNVTMSSTNAQSVWKMNTSPGINLTAVEGLNQWNGNVSLRVVRSSDKLLVIDRQDPVLNLMWKRELERGGLGVDVHYDEMSTRESQMDDTGDVVVQETSRTNISYGANWSRALTETTSLSLSGKQSETRFSSKTQINQTNRMINAGLNHLWNERWQSSATIAFSIQEPEQGSPTKLINGGVGFRWQASERLNVNSHFGVRKVSTSSGTNQGATGSGGATGVGWTNDSSIAYLSPRYSTTLSFSRSSEASSSGGFKEKDQIKGGFSYDLSEKDRTGFDLTWRRVFSGNAGQANQAFNENKSFNAWYSRAFSDTWNGRLSYQHKQINNSGQEASADVLGISFVYSLEKL